MSVEAMKLALAALRFAGDDGYQNEVSQQAITALREALAEQQQEPELRRLHAIEDAAKNLVKVKGRYHTEQAFNKLKEMLS